MKALKILLCPVLIVGTLLLVLYTTDLLPIFFQNTNLNYAIYKFIFPSKQIIFPFDVMGTSWILISLFFIFLLLLLHKLIIDRPIRIGIKITIGLFIALFLFGFVLLII